MAGFECKIPQELQKQIEALAEIDDVAPKMLEESAPIYERHIKESINRVIKNKDRSTGALVASVKSKKPKKTKNGAWISSIFFDGKDKKGTPNVIKAVGLQFGNSRQKPSPFMESANSSSSSEVTKKMQEVYEREVIK